MNEYPFAPYLFRPNQDQFSRTTRIEYVLLHELHTMEQYVTTTYRLQQLHVCVQGGYVSSTYP